MRLPLVLAFLALSGAAVAQPGAASAERDVRLDGRSIVGRWQAVEVVGDRRATADLARGELSTVLVINPTGHVILRGVDRREGAGAPAAFSGRVYGRRVAFRDLPGEAELAWVGRRLYLVDPRGRETVFVRDR